MRKIRFFLSLSATVSLLTIIGVACTTPTVTSAPLPTRDDDAGKRRRDAQREEEEEVPEEDPPLPDGGIPPGAVYAHTDKTLYLFEPISGTLTRRGDFSCLEGNDRMLDIALDRSEVMYGTSDFGLVKINPTNATCQYVKKEAVAYKYPNSLSFVPMGTVLPTQEALVGYVFNPDDNNAATLYARIDVTDGTITPIGTLNDPAMAIKYKSSGDIIALIRNGNKAYLTVKHLQEDAGTGNDLLAEIDPATGRLKAILGDIGKKNLYGFGFWAGTGYGFAGNGEVLEIDMKDAKSRVIALLPEDAGAEAWFGAGVKTLAPTAPTTPTD